MNRFEKHSKIIRFLSHLHISVVVFFVILILCIGGILMLGSSTKDRQQKSLEMALHRDIIQCYAVEGTYPPSLNYIKEHYGLTYDEESFFIDYQPSGSNLQPDITIIRK